MLERVGGLGGGVGRGFIRDLLASVNMIIATTICFCNHNFKIDVFCSQPLYSTYQYRSLFDIHYSDTMVCRAARLQPAQALHRSV